MVRHFKWMKDYNLDGVFLQRFLGEANPNSTMQNFRDKVTRNVMKGAELHGRVFVNMWDGIQKKNWVEHLKNDWVHLVDDLKITKSKSYLHHKGKPLVAIWGIGFKHYETTPEDCLEIIDWFQYKAPEKYRATVMGMSWTGPRRLKL